MHKLLSDKALSLPVEISYVQDLPIKDLRKRKDVVAAWPVLNFSAWVKYELEQGGQMLLGGNLISDVAAWKSAFSSFWMQYRSTDPNHPIYDGEQDSGCEKDYGSYVPYMIHGDEGRGRMKLPLLTISFQCLMSHYGSHRLNTSGQPGLIHPHSKHLSLFLYCMKVL